MSQVASVRWEQKMPGTFSVTNGDKQQAVLSSILFRIYIDELTMLIHLCKCRII